MGRKSQEKQIRRANENLKKWKEQIRQLMPKEPETLTTPDLSFLGNAETKPLYTTSLLAISIRKDREEEKFPDELEQLFEEAQEVLEQDNEASLAQLKAFREQFPDVVYLYNNYGFLCFTLGHIEEGKAAFKTAWERFPNYPTSLIRYIESHLHDKKFIKKVPELLQYKFDLNLLFPDKEPFGFYEVATFYGVVGLYLVNIGKLDQAQICYEFCLGLAEKWSMKSGTVDALGQRIREALEEQRLIKEMLLSRMG